MFRKANLIQALVFSMAAGGAATAAVAGLVVWAALAQARDGRHPAPR